MQALIRPLNELAEFEEISRDIRKGAGMIRVCGCVNSQKTHMMYALSDGCNYRVIACSSESKAKQVYEEYRFLDPNTHLYPAKDLLFYQADLRSKELVSQRMEVIQAVAAGEKATVITSFDAFMDTLLPKDVIVEKTVRIANDSTFHLEEMQSRLVALGYDREVQIEAPGQFAVRGGILDVYPLTEELPIRIELWGDEVDSIRTFDVETQRSIENLEEVSICPAVEFPQEGEKGVSFLDYFPMEETILFLDEPVRLIEKGQGVEEEFLEAQKKRVESGYEVTDAEVQLYHTEEILRKMNAYSSVGFFALEDVYKRQFQTFQELKTHLLHLAYLRDGVVGEANGPFFQGLQIFSDVHRMVSDSFYIADDHVIIIDTLGIFLGHLHRHQAYDIFCNLLIQVIYVGLLFLNGFQGFRIII